MFLYQAQKAFNLWHNLTPNIDDQLINYLYND
jgi:shikimate dehydrogenase